MCVIDDDNDDSNIIKFQPSIMLIEFLCAIFWELSFLGSPEERNNKTDEINSIVKEFDEEKKNGTSKYITRSYDEIKSEMINKFKDKEN